jgi:hypothetical protein
LVFTVNGVNALVGWPGALIAGLTGPFSVLPQDDRLWRLDFEVLSVGTR